MSKADRMLEESGWIKVAEPENLEPIFHDYYSDNDQVYEYRIERSGEKILTCRLWFIDDSFGFSYKDIGIEVTIQEHLAIHEKMKELGWLDAKD